MTRLVTLLSTYDSVARTMLASSTLESAALDTVFSQLRDYQQKHWIEGQAWIDRLGLAACDLLEVAGLHGPRGPAFDRSAQNHALALAFAREALLRELVT